MPDDVNAQPIPASKKNWSTLVIALATAPLFCAQFAPQARAANPAAEIGEEVVAPLLVDLDRVLGKVFSRDVHPVYKPVTGHEEPPHPTGSSLAASAENRLSLASSVENRLSTAYRSTALDKIRDSGVRERIANVIHSHTVVQLAALAGREKQFVAVTNSEQYTMSWRYSNEMGTATDKDNAVSDGAGKAARELEIFISLCSDSLPISAFSSEFQYQQALKELMTGTAEALTEEDDKKWKFSVSSGEFEMPAFAKVGNVEVTAGSINLYEVAEKVADKLFNGSAIAAALAPVGSGQSSGQPSAQLVSDEEQQRRQIENDRDLSQDDLMQLKHIAPNIFA